MSVDHLIRIFKSLDYIAPPSDEDKLEILPIPEEDKHLTAEELFEKGKQMLRERKPREIRLAYWAESSARGYVPATRAVANCFYCGRGIKQDVQHAIELYESVLPDASAYNSLCGIYRRNHGIKPDLEKSAEYGRLATEMEPTNERFAEEYESTLKAIRHQEALKEYRKQVLKERAQRMERNKIRSIMRQVKLEKKPLYFKAYSTYQIHLHHQR